MILVHVWTQFTLHTGTIVYISIFFFLSVYRSPLISYVNQLSQDSEIPENPSLKEGCVLDNRLVKQIVSRVSKNNNQDTDGQLYNFINRCI